PFGHEQVVALEQRRPHRPGGDREGLEQERADHEREQQRLDDYADGFAKPAGFLLRFVGHAHVVLWFSALVLPARRARSNALMPRPGAARTARIAAGKPG